MLVILHIEFLLRIWVKWRLHPLKALIRGVSPETPPLGFLYLVSEGSREFEVRNGRNKYERQSHGLT